MVTVLIAVSADDDIIITVPVDIPSSKPQPAQNGSLQIRTPSTS